jgi:hypothetical protein
MPPDHELGHPLHDEDFYLRENGDWKAMCLLPKWTTARSSLGTIRRCAMNQRTFLAPIGQF